MLHYPVRRLLKEVPITGPSDAHCLVIDATTTLARIKKSAAGSVLRCAAVPEDYIRRVLTKRDAAMGGRVRATCR